MTPSPAQIHAAATAIANARGMRRGVTCAVNIDLMRPEARAAVMADGEAAARAVLQLLDHSEITICPRCMGTGVYNFGECSICNATGRLGEDGTAFVPDPILSRETPLIHCSVTPFVAICGADVPNQRTSQIPSSVTCAKCIALMRPPLPEVAIWGTPQAAEILAGVRAGKVIFPGHDPKEANRA